MKPTKITYTKATESDIQHVISLHQKTFRKNFTTLLGTHFLYHYYCIFLNKSFYFFIAIEEEEIIGFIVGVDNYKLLAKQIKRRAHLLFFPILRSLLNINIIPIVFKRAYSFITNSRANPIPEEFNKYNEITSLAVSTKAQGLGIGTGLLKHYLSYACEKKVPGIFITTDATNNKPTIYFYKKNGFSIAYSYKQTKQRKMHLMLTKCK